MHYETNCTEITIERWNELMKNSRQCSYKNLVDKVKKHLPELYSTLCLDMPNPYGYQSRQTRTHYILIHSAIEYFIKKK